LISTLKRRVKDAAPYKLIIDLCNSPLQPGIPFYAKTRNNIGKTCFDKV